jgi:hydrogenase expression/formation protein HypE
MILLGHGSGGRLTAELIRDHFLPQLDNPALAQLTDSAILEDDLALTTDAYVVSPRVFPGGDLGRLAVCGTVNDLAAVGARPLGLTAAVILEEGLPLAEVDRLAASMGEAAREAGVPVVAGDTKVVPRGGCDGAFITTAGVGRRDPTFRPEPGLVAPGDAVVITGTLADHGVAVLACREGIPLGGDLVSDVAPLWGLVEALRSAQVPVHAMRDPTRGGVAQSLLELASAAGVRVVLQEDSLPVRPAVRAACELLGLDPLAVACEGKLLVLLPAAAAAETVAVLRQHPLGRDAAIIGTVEAGRPGAELATPLGARRALRMPAGELLPRIC